MNEAINQIDRARVLLNLARSDAVQGEWPHTIQELQACIRVLSALHNELQERHLSPERGLPHIEPITTQLRHMPNENRL